MKLLMRLFNEFLMAIQSMALVRRELLELSQKKRTYVLRGLIWFVFLVVFLVSYAEVTARTTSFVFMLGQGREISEALFITLIVTLYALNPIMACTAITSEKEKQTLGLLITSRLTPTEIVTQKIVSHMLPLLTLLLVATPLFAVSYLFGGISFAESIAGLFVLLTAVLQITVVAVFCSALLESGIAAFWATYAVLAVLYFTLPILREMELLRIDWSNMPDEEFLLFPVYQLAMVLGNRQEFTDVLPMSLLSCLVTFGFAVAARFAVVRFSYGGAVSFAAMIRPVKRSLVRFTEQVVRATGLLSPSGRNRELTIDQLHDRLLKKTSLNRVPVSWREMKRSVTGNRKLHIIFTIVLVLFTIALMKGYPGDRVDICGFMSLGGLIAAVLLIISLTCRLFAAEREKQTFDSLLTLPISNRELLKQKLHGVNMLILTILIPLILLGIVNLFGTGFSLHELTGRPDNSITWESHRVIVGSSKWMFEAARFLTCIAGCSFIYLHLSMWVAVFWGLKLKTQMKAIMATIVTLLSLCFLPMLLLLAMMRISGSGPQDFPMFFFSSPLIIPAINEFHEVIMIVRDGGFLGSLWLVILINFAVYGTLALCIRYVVLKSLAILFERIDMNTESPLQRPVRQGSLASG